MDAFKQCIIYNTLETENEGEAWLERQQIYILYVYLTDHINMFVN